MVVVSATNMTVDTQGTYGDNRDMENSTRMEKVVEECRQYRRRLCRDEDDSGGAGMVESVMD